MKLNRLSLAVALVVLLLAGVAQASSITYNFFGPVQSTNFSTFITLPQFDPSFGPLNSVALTLTGNVFGRIGFENANIFDPPLFFSPAADFTYALQALETIQTPYFTPLTVLLPSTGGVESLPDFDGFINFAGPSGRDYVGLFASDSFFDVFTLIDDGPLFTMFIGLGTISFPVAAQGTSFVSSSNGTEVSGSMTKASANGRVTYNYGAIPLPATLWLLGGGLIGLVGFGRKFLR